MMSVKRWAWIVSVWMLCQPVVWAGTLPETAADLANVDVTKLDEDAQFALWGRAAEKGWSWRATAPYLRLNAVNAQGRNIAHIAAHFGRVDWLARMPEKLLNQPDDTDNLPIHSAVWAGRLETARWLFEHGASLSATNRQRWQPLHMAVFNGHVRLVRWLLTHHVPVNAVTQEGWTPLGLAISQGACYLVGDLRAAGADVNQPVKVYGRTLTPLQLAQALEEAECVAALR